MLRSQLRRLTRLFLSAAARLGSRNHAVVHGWPDSEGNSLRAAAVLAGALESPVYLLCDNVPRMHGLLASLASKDPGAARVIPVGKRTLRALALTASARLVLFTHGLFGSPAPGAKRIIANLWHGHGPKRTSSREFAVVVPSDLLVTNTGTWGRSTAAAFELPATAVANIGNPRQDAMLDAPAPDGLARLGLSLDRPYALWMPTFRGVRKNLNYHWQDSELLSGAVEHSILDALRTAVISSGVDFRVKIHPLDRDLLDAFKDWRVTDADLVAAGLPLYSLIGGAAGLISDYSSVWVEYLSLDRPLLLFCPDIEEYRDGRGLKSPSMIEIAGGLIETEAAAIADFLRAIAAGKDWRADQRRAAAEALELAEPGPCAHRLVEAIRAAAARKGVALHWRPDR